MSEENGPATLEQVIEAMLIVADSNGMKDDKVIPIWPEDVAQSYPTLTVGAVREWQNKAAPKGDIKAMGNLQFEEGESHPRSILVTFDTEEDCRKAVQLGACEYTVMEREQ